VPPLRLTADLVLEHRIGCGGMGAVWRARRDGPGGFSKAVAVKLLRSDRISPADQLMFLEEARLAARLCHPKLVQVFELARVGGVIYQVMELVDGIDLSAALAWLRARGRRLLVDDAVHLVRAVLHGLAHVHQARDGDGRLLGMVHRDVGPQNVLLAADSAAVKLGDFGIAWALRRSFVTEPGLVKGRPQRMPPEQMLGAPIDQRADLYTAGVLLYELVVGEGPFARLPPPRLLRTRDRRGFVPASRRVPGLPPALDAIIRCALEPAREHRFATAREMLAELAPLGGSEAAAAARLATLVDGVRRAPAPGGWRDLHPGGAIRAAG